FHDHQLLSIVLEQLVDRRDPGMVEAGHGNGLGMEAPSDCRILEPGIEDLDGDLAVQELVDRGVDGSHPTAAHLPRDAVLADALADHDLVPYLIARRAFRARFNTGLQRNV